MFGEPDGRRWSPRVQARDAERLDALLAAAAYFEGETLPPPPELEATQGDVAELLRGILRGEPGPRAGLGRALQDALDAVDDGLPPDVVLDTLQRVLGAAGRGSAVEAIAERYRARATD